MKVIKSFEESKLVDYFGIKINVPKDTTHLAIQQYADSDNAMLVAFDERPKFVKLPSGRLWRVAASCRAVVVAKVDPEGLSVADSLVEV